MRCPSTLDRRRHGGRRWCRQYERSGECNAGADRTDVVAVLPGGPGGAVNGPGLGAGKSRPLSVGEGKLPLGAVGMAEREDKLQCQGNERQARSLPGVKTE